MESLIKFLTKFLFNNK